MARCDGGIVRPKRRGGSVLELELRLDWPHDGAGQALAQAISGGSLLGASVLLGECGPQHLTFGCPPGLDGEVPERGELRWAAESPGSCLRLTCRLWCRAQRRRILLRSAATAALGLALATLAWSWLPVLAAPVALLLAVALDLLGWRRLRHRWAGRLQACLHNAAWLRATPAPQLAPPPAQDPN